MSDPGSEAIDALALQLSNLGDSGASNQKLLSLKREQESLPLINSFKSQASQRSVKLSKFILQDMLKLFSGGAPGHIIEATAENLVTVNSIIQIQFGMMKTWQFAHTKHVDMLCLVESSLIGWSLVNVAESCTSQNYSTLSHLDIKNIEKS